MGKEQIIKDAQYRKGLSIAYFNSTNAAIELAKVMFPDMPGVDVEVFIIKWRDFFLKEHEAYYAQVIERIGVPYNAKESIAKLKKVTTLEELRIVWRNFSEDERHDEEIHKVAKAVKANLQK